MFLNVLNFNLKNISSFQLLLLSTAYSDDRQKNNIDCANLDPEERDITQACRFDLDFIHQSCAPPDYGFGEGQPCILLKLNKVYIAMASNRFV